MLHSVACHAGLYEDPGHTLDAHQQDGSAALRGGCAPTVADNINQSLKLANLKSGQNIYFTVETYIPYSVLGLYTEEEGGGEVLDVLHTDNMVRIPFSVGRKVSWRTSNYLYFLTVTTEKNPE